MAVQASTVSDIAWSRIDYADIHYLAGLIDGEGCIYAQQNAAGIKVSMTTMRAVEWAHRLFGGSLRTTHHKLAQRPVNVWSLQRQAVLLDLLPVLIPALRTKRDKASGLLDLTRHKQDKPYPRQDGFSEWKLERDRLVEVIKATEDR